MNLSRFFTLEEMTFSQTAKAEGIDNQPGAAETESLRALCTTVLDPLREAVGKPIKVNSGYRGPSLNRRLKGATKSQHLTGQAADIQSPGTPVLELFKMVIRLQLPFDQLIYEVNGASKWVHVSHAPGANDGEILLGKFDAQGRVTYPRLTAEQALAMTEPVTRSRGAAAEPGYVETADEPPRQAPRAPAKRAPAKKAVAAKKAPTKAPVTATASQPAAKKAAVKRPAAKKAAVKSTAVKKAAAKRPVARKVAVKPTAAKTSSKPVGAAARRSRGSA